MGAIKTIDAFPQENARLHLQHQLGIAYLCSFVDPDSSSYKRQTWFSYHLDNKFHLKSHSGVILQHQWSTNILAHMGTQHTVLLKY